MAETLTESFCERCGTRYEFRAPTRLNPLRKTRGMLGGLKNYLTSQDALSDAMGDAMRAEQGALASAQLEAFHESFNFCIDCRQYTCINCWNNDAGRCRTCAPIAGTDDLVDRMSGTFGEAQATPWDGAMAEDDLQRRLGLDIWPTVDLPSEATTNGHATIADWPSSDQLASTVSPAPEPPTIPEPEPFAFEAMPQPEPEPVAFEAAPEPEPVAFEAVPEPEPEPIRPEPAPKPRIGPSVAPIGETILRFPERPAPTPNVTPAPAPAQPGMAAEDESPELAARRAQLDMLGLGDPGQGPVRPQQRTVLPYRSRGAAIPRGELAARAAAQGIAFWEASAREVAEAGATTVGVQNCGGCGLSLSANARFCRRCGSPQSQTA